MNLKELSDIEIAKLIAEQNALFFQTSQNLQALNQELSVRLEKAKEAEKKPEKKPE